jgi:solute:Na+ symporter, SSS family
MIQFIILAIYFVIMAIIGIVSRKSARTAEDFFVAGRSGSTLWIAGSLVATIIGGSATVGVAGLGFSRGLTGAWWLLVGSIGLIFLGLFLAKKIRKWAGYTLPGLVEKQYGRQVALATSVLIVIAWLGVIAGQIVATGKILSALGIGDPVFWMVIFTAVFVFYTAIGGQYADIRTDLIQAGVIFVGIIAGVVVLLSQLGGFGGIQSALPSQHFSFPLSTEFGLFDFIGYLLLVGLTYVVGPDIYSRILSTKNEKIAQASVLWAALVIIPITFAGVIIGMGAAVLFPAISAEQAFPMVVSAALPPLVGGLVLVGLVSATMSSADSCLLSASTILTVDIIKQIKPSLGEREVLLIARSGIIVLGILALLLALALKGVISSLMFAYTIFTSGVIIPVLFGFYRKELKITPKGSLAAIIGGGGIALISKLPTLVDINQVPLISDLLAIKHLDLWSLAVSVVLLFAVSWIENGLRSWSNLTQKTAGKNQSSH